MTILELFEKISSQFPYSWSIPTNLDFGVLTTNQAFIQAQNEGRKPPEVATKLAQNIESFIHSQHLPFIVKIVGPYINLDFAPETWSEILKPQTLTTHSKKERKILLDYVSPNIAKPLHVGHIRNANLGESLRRILKLTSTDLITNNYWGDWGIQMGILIWSWKQFLEKRSLELEMNGEQVVIKYETWDQDPLDTCVKLYVWGNQQKETRPNWEREIKSEFLKLENGDQENRSLWQQFLAISQKETNKDLALLNIPVHDLQYGESHYEAEFRNLWEFLEQNDLWQKEGKARFFDFEELTKRWKNASPQVVSHVQHLGRCYLISSDGYSTYAFRDIAARISWVRDLGRNQMITITGNEQKHHFEQSFAIIIYLSQLPQFIETFGPEVSKNLTWDHLTHISYGFLKLPTGKMSTRRGNFVTARDLIQTISDSARAVLVEKSSEVEAKELDQKSLIVAIAALKWYDLARDSSGDITLDIPKILSFEGNTGVYQLYTLARINSILRKNSSITGESANLNQPANVLNTEEKQILKKLFLFPLIIEQVAEHYKPHLLCNHLFELATMTNSWYAKFSVTNETNPDRKTALLLLCKNICNQIAAGLDLLGIEPVDDL